MKRGLAAVLLGTCWLLGAFTAPAHALVGVSFFVTPSHNIACAWTHERPSTNFLRCDVRHLAHKAPKPRGCEFDFGSSFGMTGRGRAHALCVSDSVADPRARVLPYGTTRRYGPFKCTSRTTGLRCSNSARHGFVLNRDRYRLF